MGIRRAEPMSAAAPVAESLARVPESHVLDDPLEVDPCTRWLAGEGGRRLADSGLQVSGMYCAACADTIEAALTRVPGVRQASVVAATQRARVVWDPELTRLSALIGAVRAAGYDAVPDAAAPAREMRRREHRSALWRLFVASFCAMQVMMLATPSYVAPDGDLSADMRQLLNWGGWILTLPVMGFAAGPFIQGAWQHLRRGRIGMDVPVALALLVTFIASMGATFDPRGPFGHEVYFDSLTMFLSFLLGGRYLELRARHRAAEELEQALARLPETCERSRPDGTWETVSVRRLQPGDDVRVVSGQAFPADGVLLQGRTQVDEALLTGESTPLARAQGDGVVAASVNVGGPVVMRVQRVGADTRYDAIVSMMRDALSQRPAGARMADRWAAPFLWAVLALAAGGGLAWWFIDASRAVWVAVSVLVVTCPCALSLAAPAALVSAAGGLARRGVVFKRLEAIEALAGVTHVVFDKTGTLTEDRLTLSGSDIARSAHVDADQALRAAASLAAWSTHPVSRALAAHAGGQGDEWTWREIAEQPGRGLEAVDGQGRRWRLGSPEWVGAQPDGSAAAARVALACDGVLQSTFRFDEAVREDAADAVARLHALGLQVSLLTGDDGQRATALAQRLGIHDVQARATPEGKLEWVAARQRDGARVAMVGDGINDAPVLARSDVSLAMGQGALVARTQADAVIASNRPADLARAFDTARRTVRIVHQNLAWAAAYNAACIPLALAGWLPPWAAGLGMAASSLFVIGNAMRAAR
jgi:Cu2+-exporting ATPase